MIISIVLGLVIGMIVLAAADISWVVNAMAGAMALANDSHSLISRRLYDWRRLCRTEVLTMTYWLDGANVFLNTMIVYERRYQCMVMCTLM